MITLLTIPETAKALGFKSTAPVYARISDGRLRSVDVSKSGERTQSRVRSDDLEGYIASCTQPALKRGAT